MHDTYCDENKANAGSKSVNSL